MPKSKLSKRNKRAISILIKKSPQISSHNIKVDLNLNVTEYIFMYLVSYFSYIILYIYIAHLLLLFDQ